MQNQALAAALETLRAETAALQNLTKALEADPALPAALSLLQAVTLNGGGRVIVTGVGKSGHIGGKIAATLASTGTPAFFVHPTEALHGDLGMITKSDVIIALSHSGESKELAAVVTYATRFSIPLIAVTGKPASTLAKAAKVTLNTRVEKEACPLNLAPTTSTTVALALCDALAVALMTARGFSKEDFAVFHPGGKLGAQLLRVKEIMVDENLPLHSENAPMADVLVTLTASNLGCVGLTDAKGNLTGIFTDGDLKRRLTPDLLSRTVADVMTRTPKTITPDALATAAVAHMEQTNVTTLWVTDKNKPVGLLRIQECLHANVI
ncbi:MAG: KpsF/GutQ family sugar-phosphate isomerase [Blastochloris viridis]|uniref:KpsF/GutQ family sugar-phosphate isomerase n=1 Tax=Blastochloris viridis TaxID=1079 RepID=A0A6N4QZD8_BLAVI|nr:MAG: KpsF/GutQ family sugar-phosphate isomerase [Blastochloris viridis]